MKLLNEGLYFEPAGDGFIYRPTVFSAGFTVSADEKELLYRAILRLELRYLIEGFCVVAVIAALFLFGIIASPTPILWFAILSIVAVIAMLPIAIRRRGRAVRTVLGERTPDVPRRPWREALMRPRPLMPGRHVIPVLRSVLGLFVLAAAFVDLAALSPLVVPLLPQDVLASADRDGTVTKVLEQTLYSGLYWAIVAATNAVLMFCILLMKKEIKRIRSLPEMADGNS